MSNKERRGTESNHIRAAADEVKPSCLTLARRRRSPRRTKSDGTAAKALDDAFCGPRPGIVMLVGSRASPRRARRRSWRRTPAWSSLSQEELRHRGTAGRALPWLVSRRLLSGSAAQTFGRFVKHPRHHDECRGDVRPPPPKPQVRRQADEERERQVTSDQRFRRLGDERARTEPERVTALQHPEERQ
jgi:hypothetical protein